MVVAFYQANSLQELGTAGAEHFAWRQTEVGDQIPVKLAKLALQTVELVVGAHHAPMVLVWIVVRSQIYTLDVDLEGSTGSGFAAYVDSHDDARDANPPRRQVPAANRNQICVRTDGKKSSLHNLEPMIPMI